MPIITIELSDEQLKKVKETLSYNGNLDLKEETFNGSSIELDLLPFIHMMTVKGYKEEYIGAVFVEIPKE
ncbi:MULTISPECIES: hypothetical protein [Empedobacter]|uniref:hypothetical protein n=1 Tax=Empedobacter TaxID=59734 RepID=UPI001CE11E05|nr:MULTISPECIES: hypothetical protein [Empedobacter]MCA4781326.1 hypothetical protein [Empedobacter stercoris]MDM1043058.1 hypothetical protein [Empedobacter brevis]MDM1136975.1 hypothetical protein [Empedobacter sp. R750]MDM1522476.1 hypothetical protein [Empedobacter sp. 225-1]MDM1542666.1 hypothetical protein [Empedobacter sp. 189-2]